MGCSGTRNKVFWQSSPAGVSPATVSVVKGLVPPGGALGDHGVADRQEFAHASHQGELLGLTGGQQALVHGTYHGGVSDRGAGGHIQHRSHGGTATPDPARACPLATLTVEGRPAA